ncbi:hypothetical protein SAMN05216188_13111 [Lentzea xinjiangensis]|uniref:Uncharacterized protein n=1 Tax=Lentzea xinjiangensis TaxID=402600 RepID=A0A1H9W7V7_9PSEU|nr:hypothetical protein [Lentzea xinjiangensis]SES29757.1 hypothetical protein SAMN05216188_13111 [Lentzea xinjiangensis]
MPRHQRQTQAKHPAREIRHVDEPSERVSMATLTPAALPELQRTIGNAAVARMVADRQNATGTNHAVQRSAEHDGSCSPEHRHDDLSVQRAPSANGETSSQKSAQPTYAFADVKGANPSLWTDLNDNYWVGTGPPPGQYIVQVEQHCGYMSTYWLTHGHGAGGLRFADLEESERIRASDTVRRWGASGGRQAQTDHAAGATGGHPVTLASLDSDVAAGELPPGTLIWFGNDAHAEAAVVTAKGQFLMYDPNTGMTTTRDPNGFRSYIATKNVFVVKPGAGADPATCKCCVVM